jgi:predicted DNA-binding transcriptional regulator YafY
MDVAPSFDLKAWIKGFLPHVHVVRPASLRDEIAREIEASRAAFPGPGGA